MWFSKTRKGWPYTSNFEVFLECTPTSRQCHILHAHDLPLRLIPRNHGPVCLQDKEKSASMCPNLQLFRFSSLTPTVSLRHSLKLPNDLGERIVTVFTYVRYICHKTFCMLLNGLLCLNIKKKTVYTFPWKWLSKKCSYKIFTMEAWHKKRSFKPIEVNPFLKWQPNVHRRFAADLVPLHAVDQCNGGRD